MPATKNKSKTPTTIRLDDDLKAEMLKDLEPMGISLNSYFNMAGRQLVIQKKIPFEILTEKSEPNLTTRKALITAEAKALGIIHDVTHGFTNFNDLKEYLDAE